MLAFGWLRGGLLVRSSSPRLAAGRSIGTSFYILTDVPVSLPNLFTPSLSLSLSLVAWLGFMRVVRECAFPFLPPSLFGRRGTLELRRLW